MPVLLWPRKNLQNNCASDPGPRATSAPGFQTEGVFGRPEDAVSRPRCRAGYGPAFARNHQRSGLAASGSEHGHLGVYACIQFQVAPQSLGLCLKWPSAWKHSRSSSSPSSAAPDSGKATRRALLRISVTGCRTPAAWTRPRAVFQTPNLLPSRRYAAAAAQNASDRCGARPTALQNSTSRRCPQ